jgi:hypothetical protein
MTATQSNLCLITQQVAPRTHLSQTKSPRSSLYTTLHVRFCKKCSASIAPPGSALAHGKYSNLTCQDHHLPFQYTTLHIRLHEQRRQFRPTIQPCTSSQCAARYYLSNKTPIPKKTFLPFKPSDYPRTPALSQKRHRQRDR